MINSSTALVPIHAVGGVISPSSEGAIQSTSTGQEAVDRSTVPALLRVLMVGDVIGSPGRRSLERLLPRIRSELRIDLVIANGENSAGGKGISIRTAREMRDAGVDVITTGNHVWTQADIDQALGDDDLRILRPLNFPVDLPGSGSLSTFEKRLTVLGISQWQLRRRDSATPRATRARRHHSHGLGIWPKP